MFLQRLNQLASCRQKLCVGLDPHENIVTKWGLNYDVAGAEKMARQTIEALGDLVCAFKPQSAFFECFGSPGIAALERVLKDIRQTGALSILDVKRGDIGSTMAAYAKAYLGDQAPLSADAITLSPYCGFEALRPALDLAKDNNCGVYVLCRTSNLQGSQVQLKNSEGKSVAQMIVDQANAENMVDGSGYVGLVIGATHNLDVDLEGFTGSILAPGIGAQGGSVSSLSTIFGDRAEQVLASASRSILSAGPGRHDLRRRVLESLSD